MQDEFGIDFTHYKPSTVTRRIERRLALARSQDIDKYVRRLRLERNELDVLYRDLLIEVTRFFRDHEGSRSSRSRCSRNCCGASPGTPRSGSGQPTDSIRETMASRAIELTVEVDPEPLWIYGDPSRFQQIQANLLSNAAKYTPSGGHVLFQAKREDGAAFVRVKDDGVGIPKEMCETIFELFVQARRTLDRSAGGLGSGNGN